jgi:hypothetical protein
MGAGGTRTVSDRIFSESRQTVTNAMAARTAQRWFL